MMLTLRFVKELFPNTKGVDDDTFYFRYVTSNHRESVHKGLYIPLNQIYGEDYFLKEALNQGAIASIWQKDKPVPLYTPTQFPLFFVEDPLTAAKTLYNRYYQQLDTMTDKTIFLLSSPLSIIRDEEHLKTEKLGGLHMFKESKESLKEGDKEC